nr:reverse transcriptase domain-containing protein [Tanacetum cinerariifolium]
MQTQSSSRLVSNPSSSPTLSTNPNPKGRTCRRLKQRIEELNIDELSPPIVMMADQCTMAQLLQAPTEGYEDAIVVLAITANNFDLKHGLLTLRFDESVSEAWDRFKDLLRACPHHGFSELHQIDTFYNALNSKDQDSLNSAAGGNFLDKMPRECLAIIESKSKVCYSRNKQVVAKKSQNQAPATMKAVKESYVTCGGAHSYRNCLATDGNVYRDNIQEFVSQAFAVNYIQETTSYRPSMILRQANDAVMRNMQTQGQNMQNQLTNLIDLITKFVNFNNASTSISGTLPSNTIANPRSDLKAITTQSVTASRPNLRPSIPYLSRMQDQKLRDKANDQREKFFQILKDLLFIISFADALIMMPKFGPSIKSLLTNKDKLYELARTPLNEHCSVVLLKKLPKKLGDPGKFLIPCDFPEKADCLALANLDARINLMAFSVWNKLSLPDLTPTCMTLELSDRSISRSIGVAEDVYVKVGSFHFRTDFVVVDFDADPRVPLILGRSFLKIRRALIDVFEGELTLSVGKEAITFNLDQTSRYSANYSDMTAKRIDVIDMACEEYSQKVIGFSDVISSGNPTPYYDPIVSTTSLTLTPFGNSDFLLEEVDAFLAIEDDPTLSKVDRSYLDPEGDILLLETFLNDDPSLPLQIKEIIYLNFVELKYLLSHIEYAFLVGDDKLPVIIAKDLSVEEKTVLITVLKSHKRAIAWKLSDIKGIDPEFCTHKILMKEDFEPVVQHQRRV